MVHVITSKWSALPKRDGPRLPSGTGPGSPHHLQTMAQVGSPASSPVQRSCLGAGIVLDNCRLGISCSFQLLDACSEVLIAMQSLPRDEIFCLGPGAWKISHVEQPTLRWDRQPWFVFLSCRNCSYWLY